MNNLAGHEIPKLKCLYSIFSFISQNKMDDISSSRNATPDKFRQVMGYSSLSGDKNIKNSNKV